MKKTRKVTTVPASSSARQYKNDTVMNLVTPIATGVAIAAGIVAAGTALTDRRNREKLGKHAQKGLLILQEVAKTIEEEEMVQYKAYSHEVAPKKRDKKNSPKTKVT